jgi:hypothetical protein
MSIAWTTLLIIALLLPGVLFFFGFAFSERYSREIVKSNAVGDVAVTIVISLVIHLLGWGFLALFGFDLASYVRPLANFEDLPPWKISDLLIGRLLPVALYILGTGGIGLLLGWVTAQLAVFSTHKWSSQVIRSMRSGLVTAYVMTTVNEGGNVLMYKGILFEFYLNPDGKFVYVVLQASSRFHMKLDGLSSMIGEQMDLFGKEPTNAQEIPPENPWNFLLLDGDNIANIFLHPSPPILSSAEGLRSLDERLAELETPREPATQPSPEARTR